MLSDTKVIALYCIVDDLLKGLNHSEDLRVRVSDSEVITTAFVAALYFGGHVDNARCFMKLKGYVPYMLDKSRFCRRLHRLADLLLLLFESMGQHLKEVAGASDYIMDSFPVAVCDNIRIGRSRLLSGEAFRGKHVAMRRYFYGVKVQVLTLEGIPVEFCFVPGSESDVRALNKLPLSVAAHSHIFADAAYTDYGSEEDLMQAEAVKLMVQRKANSKRKDEPCVHFIKQHMRKHIEATFSEIKARMLRHIHAVTTQGFLLKVALFVIAYSFEKITPN